MFSLAMNCRHFRLLSLACVCISLSSCNTWNHMGIQQKVLVMSAVNAASVFGAAAAPAVGGAALGVSVAASSPVVNRQPATTEQRNAALRAGREQSRRTQLAQNKPSNRSWRQARSSRYIAVETPTQNRSTSSSPSFSSNSRSRPATSVMVYDTQTDRLASDQVFEVKKEPREGSFVEFDTFYTQYVGDGSDDSSASSNPSQP